MTYINYKDNQYKLNKGPNGGKYITVNDKKIYMNKNKIKKTIVKKNPKRNNSERNNQEKNNSERNNPEKNNSERNDSKNIISNIEVVIMNNTNIYRKILKTVEIKDGKYLLPDNHFSKDYYERLTGFKWESLDWA